MDNFYFLFVCLYEICDFYIPFKNTRFSDDLAQMEEALAWGKPILEIWWTWITVYQQWLFILRLTLPGPDVWSVVNQTSEDISQYV